MRYGYKIELFRSIIAIRKEKSNLRSILQLKLIIFQNLMISIYVTIYLGNLILRNKPLLAISYCLVRLLPYRAAILKAVVI